MSAMIPPSSACQVSHRTTPGMKETGKVAQSPADSSGPLMAVVLIAGAVWLLTRDLERYRDEVERQLEALTGRDVTVSGDLSLALVPDLKVALSDVTIGDTDAPWLRLPEIHAVVSLTSLLTLDLAVERIRIVGPVLTIGGPDMAGSLTACRGDVSPGSQDRCRRDRRCHGDLAQRIPWNQRVRGS